MERKLEVRTVAGEPPASENRLSLPQTRALAWRALTGEENQSAIAEHAGVDESTIRYWLRSNARFRQLWETALTNSEELTKSLRSAGRLKSIETLIRAQDEAEQWSVRVDAAAKLLTSDRQDRQLESEPARMALGAILEKWARESEALLAPGSEGPAVVDGEARMVGEGSEGG